MGRGVVMWVRGVVVWGWEGSVLVRVSTHDFREIPFPVLHFSLQSSPVFSKLCVIAIYII